jgi:hypothetical protein
LLVDTDVHSVPYGVVSDGHLMLINGVLTNSLKQLQIG